MILRFFHVFFNLFCFRTALLFSLVNYLIFYLGQALGGLCALAGVFILTLPIPIGRTYFLISEIY